MLPSWQARSERYSFQTWFLKAARFGIHEAHGKGQAIQLNFLWDGLKRSQNRKRLAKGGFEFEDGRFRTMCFVSFSHT